MFGYLRPFVPDLLVREHTLYKGIYCGICKILGKRIGGGARLTLSYDAVFLALLLAAVRGEPFSVAEGRCALHPTKKRPVAGETASITLAAAASCVLFAYKVEDDRKDEHGARLFGAKTALPFVKRQRKKAAALLPGDLSALPEAFAALHTAETETALAAASPSEDSGAGIERCADCMGEIMRLLFSACDGEALASEILGKIGYHIGRWVYFADAADDYDEDLRKGRFNPFFPEKPAPEALVPALECELGAIDGIMSRLRVKEKDIDGLLRNILSEGLYRAARRIAFGEEDGRQRKDKTKE